MLYEAVEHSMDNIQLLTIMERDPAHELTSLTNIAPTRRFCLIKERQYDCAAIYQVT